MANYSRLDSEQKPLLRCGQRLGAFSLTQIYSANRYTTTKMETNRENKIELLRAKLSSEERKRWRGRRIEAERE